MQDISDEQHLGTLYAYTPEVLPSAHRATGNGIAIACNRIMGLVSAAVASSANTATSAPIYICAVLYIVMVRLSTLRTNPNRLTHFSCRPSSLLSCRSSHSAKTLCRGTEQHLLERTEARSCPEPFVYLKLLRCEDVQKDALGFQPWCQTLWPRSSAENKKPISNIVWSGFTTCSIVSGT